MTMIMDSTLARRVWKVGGDMKHTTEDVIEGLKDIFRVEESEIFYWVERYIREGKNEKLSISNQNKELVATITIEQIPDEVDMFGDLIQAHTKIVYMNELV